MSLAFDFTEPYSHPTGPGWARKYPDDSLLAALGACMDAKRAVHNIFDVEAIQRIQSQENEIAAEIDRREREASNGA